MRILTFGCAFTMIICSCKTKQEPNSHAFNENLIYGKWYLDSVSNGTSFYESLYILKNRKFHLFSYSLGGELIFHGSYKNQKLLNQYNTAYQITELDSNLLVLNDELNKSKLFYKKSIDVDIEKELKNALKNDELRSKLIGWWKYTKPISKSGLHFLSRDFYGESFIMNIRPDGEIEIFENFKTATPLLYSYQVKNELLKLQRGCIITPLVIDHIERDKLTISAEGLNFELVRIIQFN